VRDNKFVKGALATGLVVFGGAGVFGGLIVTLVGLTLLPSFTKGFVLWKLYGWLMPFVWPSAPAVSVWASIAATFMFLAASSLLVVRLHAGPHPKGTIMNAMLWTPLWALVIGKILQLVLLWAI